MIVLKPISFAASGFPNAGAWKQELPVRGHGDDVTLNVYYLATPDEKVQTLVGAPGATCADMTSQRDAFTYATAGLRVQAQDYGSYNVKNTRFEGCGYPNPPVPRREIAESVITERKSGADMARLYGVSQPTVSRIVAQHRTAL